MEHTELEVLSRFEEVWQRVQQGRTEQADTKQDNLETLMDGLYYRWMGCRQLAGCTCGTEKARLLALSERIKKQFQGLQLHFFLMKGDIHCSAATPSFASYTPYNLRKLWQSTVENEEMIKNCNLNGNSALVAELQSMDAEFQCQKTEIEWLLRRLIR